MKRRLFLSLMILGLSATGCRSQMAVYSAHDEGDGTVRTYRADSGTVRYATIAVLKKNGAEYVEQKQDHVLGDFGVTAFWWGAHAGVWIEVSADGTRVTAITKRKVAVNAVTSLTENGFHEDLAAALGEVGVER